jgi:hypothetical protein
MGRTLALTSPLTRGDDVILTQKLLASEEPDTPYGRFYHGADHGLYDEATANAVKEAKKWLGYPWNECDRLAGDGLRGFLKTKPEDLPEDYQTRRRNRLLNKSTPRPFRLQLVEEAEKHVGYVEGRNNDTKFGRWYGLNFAPWCAMFVTYCAEMCDSSTFVRGSRYAYCPYVVADAKAFRFGLKVVQNRLVLPGHIALFDWDNDNVADHIEIVTGPVSSRGDFGTIGGNTSPGTSGSQSNGGGVYRRTRNIRDVQVFVEAA